MLVRSLSDILQVACGDAHNAALTKDGTVYTWGTGMKGNLWRGEKKKMKTLQNLSSWKILYGSQKV